MILLATDLDDTLLGDDDSMHQLNNMLGELRDQHKLKLVYITGRSTQRYALLEDEKSILEPDALVPALGTEIYINGQMLSTWPQVTGWDNQLIKDRLADIQALELQPEAELR
jgi:hydroxymethylpyrimidine pyrophosphatase-like HAD family hydrolase